MKYFTPELVVRGQSLDSAILNPHEEEWDRLCAAYEAYLGTVRAQFPPGLRTLLDGYYLHDATVQGMGQQGQVFVVVLQLDTPPRSLLTLQYQLVGAPVVIRDALPPAARSRGERVEWQYDEVEMGSEVPPVWTHSILFDNGWEVRLRFTDVTVQEVSPLLPLPLGVPAVAVSGG